MRLAHVALRQIAGVVYRHCCSTFGQSVPHSMHLKLPSTRGLHSFPFPVNLSLLCPFRLNFSLLRPPHDPN